MAPTDSVINKGTGFSSQAQPAPPTTPKRANVITKSQSTSPGKRYARQPLTIRVSLTKRQMDKVTEAITQRVEISPTRGEEPSTSPLRSQNNARTLNGNIIRPTYQRSYKKCHHPGESTNSSENMLNHTNKVPDSRSLAQRRNHTPPPPINIYAQTQVPLTSLSRLESTSGPQNLGEGQSPKMIQYGGKGERDSMRASNVINTDSLGRLMNGVIPDKYGSWTNTQSLITRPEYPKRHQSLLPKSGRSQSKTESLSTSSISSFMFAGLDAGPNRPEGSPTRKNAPLPTSQFSPLPLYFRGQTFPSTRKGEKTMIGENGWLQCTGDGPSDDRKPPLKRQGFLNSLRKIAKDVTAELNSSFGRPRSRSQSVPNKSQLAISMDAREQSLLYCELEYHLASALNDYITAEFDRGHLLPGNLKKISDFWTQQGRPRVIGFRYDLETQLELVILHLNDFNFYGRRRGNPVEIMELLDSTKVNARAMRIRTFCQPDSVVAKQLVDSQSLFNLLNVPDTQHLALAEIGQFFETILQREHAKDLAGGRHVQTNGNMGGDDAPHGSM